VAHAEEDFTLAQSALRRKKPLTVGACFHAQQCAEKYLKAILLSKGAVFPKTHDLLYLSDLCAQSGVILPIEAQQLHTLSDYAARTRYPGDVPTLDDGKEALAIAKSVRKFARTLLGI
jgi:HEPN domain-containing protein